MAIFASRRGLPLILLALAGWATAAENIDRLQVGVQPDGRIVVPTNQVLRPAGRQVTFPGRPFDWARAEGGRIPVVKTLRDLVFVDADSGRVRQTLPLPRPDKGREPAFGV